MSVECLLMLSMSAVMAVSVSCQSTVDMTSCTQNNEDVAMVMKGECTQPVLLLQQLKQQVDSCNSSLELKQIDEKQTLLQQSLNQHAQDHNDTSERLRGVDRKQEQIVREMRQQQMQHVGDFSNTSQSLEALQGKQEQQLQLLQEMRWQQLQHVECLANTSECLEKVEENQNQQLQLLREVQRQQLQYVEDLSIATQHNMDGMEQQLQLLQDMRRQQLEHIGDSSNASQRLEQAEWKLEQQLQSQVRVESKQEQQLQLLDEIKLRHTQYFSKSSQRLQHLEGQLDNCHFNQTYQQLQQHEAQVLILEQMKHRQTLDQNASSQHQALMLQRIDQLARDLRNSSLRLQQVERQQEQQLVLLQQLQQQLNNVTYILLRRESECLGELSDNFQLRFNRTVAVIKSRQQLVTELRDCCNPLLVQQNVDGSNFFNRTWNEFRDGFGGSNGNYWLGNELLHQLTKDGRYKLRFDLQSRNNSQWYWAEYSTFIVHNESTGYRLQVDGFTGNVQRDAVRGHDLNEMKFTTTDRDNDQSSGGNCATRTGGGFWYKNCANCDVNTMRGRGNDFSWWLLYDNNWLLQTSRMWLMCR